MLDFGSILVFLLILIPIVVSIDFIKLIATGKRFNVPTLFWLIDSVVMVFLPLLYLAVLDPSDNDCCYESATFSPEHRTSIYAFIVLCILFFFLAKVRTETYAPLAELILNIFLVAGIVFNVFLAFHVEGFLGLIGNVPIIMVLTMQLFKSHQLIMAQLEKSEFDFSKKVEKFAWNILKSKPVYKFPIITILVLPLLSLLSLILLLFGQKPDSFIRAFTDTYKHGFSQLDFMCDEVVCGGHFLCSVAANGHQSLVKPIRLGERRNKPIICNRQLLVSNAFEDLVQQKLPRLHKLIRKNYNRVGLVVHKHYGVFKRKWVADFIYILMKPLEWFFLFVLYLFDKSPENRIHMQYINKEDRTDIVNYLHGKF